MAGPAAVERLNEQLKQLDLQKLDKYPNCYPKTNPFDAYRAHLSSKLFEIGQTLKLSIKDANSIYERLQWTAKLDQGDMSMALASLKAIIPGEEPLQALLSEEDMKKVEEAATATEEGNAEEGKKGKKKKGKELKPEQKREKALQEAKLQALATKILANWGESTLVEKPIHTGPHLQFFFKPGPLTKTLITTARGLGPNYGNNPVMGLKDAEDPSKGKKRIVIEFSSPNIAKPFHAGHLRSTIIGGFLANLYQGAGWDVVRINYLGDWGKQYGLLALGFNLYGNSEALEKDPINHLFEVYVKINRDVKEEKEKADKLLEEAKVDEAEGRPADAESKRTEAQTIADKGLDEQARQHFKAMTDGNESALAQWKQFRDLSIKRYKETYARLNIWFDEYSGESQVKESEMAAAAEKLQSLGFAEESNGALLVDFSKWVEGKEGKSLEKALIRKKDGTALYLTRDISELLHRYEKYHFDHMTYVIASQQDLHVKQFFRIVEMMGHKEIRDKCEHINFGLVLGMSTRKGTVKFLDDILRDVGDFMHDVMRKNEEKYSQVEEPQKTADTLGISAVMVQDMSGKRGNNYTFNMKTMTDFEGDTGPYLQYAHARLCSITRKAALSDEELASADLSLLTETHAINVARSLASWPDVVQNTLTTLEPTTILTYLFKMTHQLSSSYDHLRIVGSEPEVMKARMALYDAARVVLNNGMRILGLSPVERM